MSERGKHVYRFGPFRIDLYERLLRRGAEVVPLTPKAAETLLVLAASGGRVVEKEELISAVWPDSFVEEGSLARNVSALRKALGGDRDGTCYIETIARRGYRFTAPVSDEQEDARPTRSLAVLPLANLSGDPSQMYFADGMTDELISYFLKIEALHVSSRTSVMAYKDARKPLREIARELGVNWVVEGTVLQSAGRVRISVRLIDGLTEKHLWSETYEKDMRDVLALQSAVAGDISREIRIKLTPPEKAKLAESRPVNPEAYQDYLRGRFFWNQRTAEGLRKASACFGQAIGKDPSYAPAHCGLADTWAMMGSSGYDLAAPREAMPRARAAALSALEIDDTLAEAHATLGYVRLAYDWDILGAERELARAIELKPNYAITWQWQGELLLARACPDDAAKAFRHALELDPLSVPCNLGLGWAYYFWHKQDLAAGQFLRTLEIAPDVPMALYGLGLAYQLKGQHRKGLSEFRKAYERSGGGTAAVMLMGVSRALEGRRQGAEKALARLRGLAQKSYVPAVYEAFIYVALGDLDGAFEALQRACEERSSFMIFMRVEPSFEKLRLDRRYADLVKLFGGQLSAEAST